MHYLSKEHWSPRYDSTFFTTQIVGKELLVVAPPAGLGGGKSNHPAVYFRIEVFSEHRKHICLRRYSQFKWLHEQLKKSPISSQEPLSLPPGQCPWQYPTNDDFLQIRLDALREYLSDVLARPGYARHDAIRLFLELDKFEEEVGKQKEVL